MAMSDKASPETRYQQEKHHLSSGAESTLLCRLSSPRVRALHEVLQRHR